MITNLHTHTVRCGHASGTEREYIETALAGGLTRLGFSDHGTFFLPDKSELGGRVQAAQLPEYVSTLTALRKEYEGRIEIPIGLELEFDPLLFDEERTLFRQNGIEYLILGQHFCGPEGKVSSENSFGNITEEALVRYVDLVCAAMKTEAYTYVAHPDAIHYTRDPSFYQREMRRLLICAKETGTPLEINFLGIRTHRHYPNPVFWEIAQGADVVFGCDAHEANVAFDGASLAAAEEMIKTYGLHLIEQPALKDPYKTLGK